MTDQDEIQVERAKSLMGRKVKVDGIPGYLAVGFTYFEYGMVEIRCSVLSPGGGGKIQFDIEQ